MPDGIDQAWQKADPVAAYRAGVRVASMYLSWDASKNVTASVIRAYHHAGIAVLLNWESQPGAPLQGAARGAGDATEAVRQARALINAVGYSPKNRLSISFSCDTDVNASQYGRIDAYYAATKTIVHAAGFLNGVYGEADLVDHLHAKGLTDFEWQTYAWSGGRQSPQADFYQYSNSHYLAGGSVDYDHVIHGDELGAWWPPNSTHNTPSGVAATGFDQLMEQIMAWYASREEFEAAMQHRAGVGVWDRVFTSFDGKRYKASGFLTGTNKSAALAAYGSAWMAAVVAKAKKAAHR